MDEHIVGSFTGFVENKMEKYKITPALSFNLISSMVFEATMFRVAQIPVLWINFGHPYFLVLPLDWVMTYEITNTCCWYWWVTRLLLLSMLQDYIVFLGAMMKRCHRGNKLQKWAMPVVNLTRSCREFSSCKFMSRAGKILYYLPESDPQHFPCSPWQQICSIRKGHQF